MRSFSKRFFSKKQTAAVSFGDSAGRPRKEVDLQILFHLKSIGKSNREIARMMRVSEATIRRRLKDNPSSE